MVKTVTKAKPLANGEKTTWDKWTIEAVPAYNIVHMSPQGQPFHPKGRGNGYVLTFGGKRFYFSGDTEGIPEMRALQNIDVAFMCMNLPYTMTPEEAADAVLAFKPKVVIPYHYRPVQHRRLYGQGDSGRDRSATAELVSAERPGRNATGALVRISRFVGGAGS